MNDCNTAQLIMLQFPRNAYTPKYSRGVQQQRDVFKWKKTTLDNHYMILNVTANDWRGLLLAYPDHWLHRGRESWNSALPPPKSSQVSVAFLELSLGFQVFFLELLGHLQIMLDQTTPLNVGCQVMLNWDRRQSRAVTMVWLARDNRD